MGLWRLALLLAVVGAVFAEDNRNPPEVTIIAGKIRGTWKESRGGRQFAAFEGVPYARPPVAELRFQPPQPAEAWSDVLEATKPSSLCTQRNLYFNRKYVEGQEDCLYANIYSPDIEASEPMDVMVFIHGGGWISGSGDLYQADYLMDKDIVYVNFNYRLGPLGFLSTSDDEIPGNNGMKDMVMLLRWVQENIARFGGNPKSVTIFGESAGGASVHLLTLSPLAKGLFHKAIAQSGTALTTWAVASPGEPKRHAAILAKKVGCPVSPSKAFHKCLLTKTANEITESDYEFIEWGISPMIPFKPVVEQGEGAFLTLHPRNVYTTTGPINDVPFMTGVTSHEGGICAVAIFKNSTALKELDEQFNHLAPLVMLMTHYPKPLIEESFDKARKFYFGTDPLDEDDVFNGINFFSDSLFIFPALETVKLHHKYAKSNTFLYEFAHFSDRSFSLLFGAPSSDYGACHGDDLLHLFPLKELFPGIAPSVDDVSTSETLIDFFTTFAKHGRPTTDKTWQRVAHGDEAEYMHIGSPGDVQIRANYVSDRYKFWRDLPLRLGHMSPSHDEL